MRRAFFAAVGLGAGIALGVWMVRKVDRVQASLTPASLARRASDSAATLSSRFGGAVSAGRQAAAAREAELRAQFDVAR